MNPAVHWTPKTKPSLHQLFFDLRNQYGQTFVIVTHDEGLASITDRTIKMRDGMLELSTLGSTGEGNDVTDVLHTGDEQDKALETETETGMGA